jgi:hypothetical protein
MLLFKNMCSGMLWNALECILECFGMLWNALWNALCYVIMNALECTLEYTVFEMCYVIASRNYAFQIIPEHV